MPRPIHLPGQLLSPVAQGRDRDPGPPTIRCHRSPVCPALPHLVLPIAALLYIAWCFHVTDPPCADQLTAPSRPSIDTFMERLQWKSDFSGNRVNTTGNQAK